MKVCIIDQYGTEGPAYYDYSLCEWLTREDIEVSLLTCTEYELQHKKRHFSLVKAYKGTRGGKHRIIRGLRYIMSLPRVYHALIRQSPDAVHFQWFVVPWVDYLLIKMLKGKHIPVVFTAHDVLPPATGRLYQGIFSKLYRAIDGVIVHAEKNKQELIKQFNLNEAKVKVVPHGDYSLFIKEDRIGKTEAMKKLDIVGDKKVVLFFGAIREYKGLDLLFKAFSIVVKQLPETLLLVAGKVRKGTFDKYSEMIKELNIGENVIIHIGYIPQEKVALYLDAADIVVLPYRKIYESGVLHLAYSYGKAVVATKVGGMTDVVEDGKNGILVPPNDEVALAKAITEILKNDAMRTKIGEYNLVISKEKYSWENSARKTLEFYRELCNLKDEHKGSI